MGTAKREKNMRRVFFLVVSLLYSPHAYGSDAGVVAASLKDEESECRYLLGLCDEVRSFSKQAKDISARFEAINKKGKVASDKLIGESSAIIDLWMSRITDTSEAMRVIRAKHEKRPACFDQCADVIAPEKFP